VVNPYHVLVRRRNEVAKHYVKMSLQLYQVDYKSYLLDFKSLPLKDEDSGNSAEDSSSGQGSLIAPSKKPETEDSNSSASTLPELSQLSLLAGSQNPTPVTPGGHHTMEFFEMCAALITQLAR